MNSMTICISSMPAYTSGTLKSNYRLQFVLHIRPCMLPQQGLVQHLTSPDTRQPRKDPGAKQSVATA